ncbi:MAG: MotA/TolQ/ExbB proton channel family protein [Myxococcota bacterium]
MQKHTLLLSSLVMFVVAVAFVSPAASQGADAFATQEGALDARLDGALRNLAGERDRIAREKLPLSKAVAALEAEVASLRRERERFQKVEDASTIDLASLRKQVASLGDQDEFVKSRLGEFLRDFEGRLGIAELPRYESLTETAKLSAKNVNLDADGKRASQIAVVDAALERVRDQLGGQRFAGEALRPTGEITPGQFISVGPTTFFVADDGSTAGLVEAQLNAADPVVVPLPETHDASLVAVASTGSGLLPLDPTLGKALKVEKARKTVSEYIADGGVVGYVILGLGLSALLLTGFKAIEIVGFKVAGHDAVDDILEDLALGAQAAAAKRAAGIEGVSGDMLQTGVDHAAESRGVIEELLFEKVLRVRPTLERFLPFLAITAAAAPLLGLLGTVIGMINTFQLITIFGTGDAKSLSSGISEALMTTALGLVVAIPTLILHGALSRMAKRKLGLLEELSVAFVNGLDVLRGRDGRV